MYWMYAYQHHFSLHHIFMYELKIVFVRVCVRINYKLAVNSKSVAYGQIGIFCWIGYRRIKSLINLKRWSWRRKRNIRNPYSNNKCNWRLKVEGTIWVQRLIIIICTKFYVPMPTLKDDERKESGTYKCVIIATMCSLSKWMPAILYKVHIKGTEEDYFGTK